MVEEITSTSVCEITDGDSEGEMTTQDYLEALLKRNKIPRTREKKQKLGDQQSLVSLPIERSSAKKDEENKDDPARRGTFQNLIRSTEPDAVRINGASSVTKLVPVDK